MDYEVSESKCAFLDKHVLINLQRFTAHSQIQFCARIGGWGSAERKAQFLHLRNSVAGENCVPARRIKEMPQGQQVEDGEKTGPKHQYYRGRGGGRGGIDKEASGSLLRSPGKKCG